MQFRENRLLELLTGSGLSIEDTTAHTYNIIHGPLDLSLNNTDTELKRISLTGSSNSTIMPWYTSYAHLLYRYFLYLYIEHKYLLSQLIKGKSSNNLIQIRE